MQMANRYVVNTNNVNINAEQPGITVFCVDTTKLKVHPDTFKIYTK
jgi:hypothetical protein